MDTTTHPVMLEDSIREMLEDLLQAKQVLKVTSNFELCFRLRT